MPRPSFARATVARAAPILALAAVLAGAPVTSAVAQAPPTSAAPADSAIRLGGWSMEAWAGYSTRSTDLGFLGNMPDQRLALAALRVGRRIAAHPNTVLEYTAELIPLALLSPPARVLPPGTPGCPVDGQCGILGGSSLGAGSAKGAGVSPLGLTVIFRPAHALQFRAGATGGVLWFDEAVPMSTATHFNFTAALEAGAQLVDRNGRGVTLVYRFHHLSNGGTGDDNPGIGSHVFSLGARWRVGRR